MNETFLVRVQLPITSAADTVVSIQGVNYLAGTSITTLAATNPQFYLLKDIAGKDILCTVVVEGVAPFQAIFNNGATGNYTVVAVPMPTLDYIGGHPKHRPRP